MGLSDTSLFAILVMIWVIFLVVVIARFFGVKIGRSPSYRGPSSTIKNETRQTSSSDYTYNVDPDEYRRTAESKESYMERMYDELVRDHDAVEERRRERDDE
jgi:hypothetical protein